MTPHQNAVRDSSVYTIRLDRYEEEKAVAFLVIDKENSLWAPGDPDELELSFSKDKWLETFGNLPPGTTARFEGYLHSMALRGAEEGPPVCNLTLEPSEV